MNWKEFFIISKLKIIFLVITFFIIFFVNIPILFNPCYWEACPDYLRTGKIVALHPNFYIPDGCGWVQLIFVGNLRGLFECLYSI